MQVQQQNKRQQQTKRQSTQIDHSDDELELSPSQILERVKPDRVTVTKPEEDRRRRTIIVEKKNGSYGFTLQSYGIHYKKEQEIEMITYVDYVDYDGPAYRAGMREGDVILSINGTDMEKADHKTLVNFIKNCDSRMRMVVLFEDCVRKVELHIRYIQLQRILQSKMNELEKLCLRERQLLEGKWKTHSLPARKKASSSSGEPGTPTQQASYSYCRPTLSTEDIVKAPPQPPPALMLAYQYLDPHYRAYVFQPSTSNSGEYLLSFGPSRCRGDQHHFIVKTPCDSQSTRSSNKNYQQTNGHNSSNSNNKTKPDKQESQSHRYGGGHLCNPCIKSNSNQDSTSLEAYDLASPCCDPHCVPSARRRSRNHKDHHNKRECKTGDENDDNKKTHQHVQRNKAQQQPTNNQQQQQQQHVTSVQPRATPRHRYFSFGAGLVSQCSLHSCTSSEFSNTAVAGLAESSAASYTTSLSTDTLYWDAPGEFNTPRQHSSKTLLKQHTYHPPQQHYAPLSETEHVYTQYNPVKPKSWDNLTTKAFGGYGFGYGYLDTSAKQKQNHTKVQNKQSVGNQTAPCRSNNERVPIQTQTTYGTRCSRRYVHPTKSTESLLALPKYEGDPSLSDSSLSCECLDVTTPDASTHGSQFFSVVGTNIPSPTESRGSYYSRRNSRTETQQINIVSTSSEMTRL